MALFTDFFPSAGGGDLRQSSTAVAATGSYNLAVVTASSIGTLAGPVASIAAGDQVSFSVSGVPYAGIVSTAPSGGTIMLQFPRTYTIAAATGLEITVTRGGESIVFGDQSIAGDINVAGDVTHEGDNFTTNSGVISLGDSDTTTTTIDGNTVTIGGGASSTTTLNSQTVSLGRDGEGTVTVQNELRVDKLSTDNTVAFVGRDADNDLTELTIGTGLSLNHNDDGTASTISVSSLSLNNTLAYSDTRTSITEADAIAGLVAAWNTSGTPSNGYTVTTGEQLSSGDLILLGFNEDISGTATAVTESFIYIGADVTSTTVANTGTIAAGDLIDITHSGDVVESVAAAASNPNIIVAGTTTTPTIALDLSESDSGDILFNNEGVLDGSLISQVAGTDGLTTDLFNIDNGNGASNALAGGSYLGTRADGITAYYDGSGSFPDPGGWVTGSVVTFASNFVTTNTDFSDAVAGNSYTITGVSPQGNFSDGATVNHAFEFTLGSAIVVNISTEAVSASQVAGQIVIVEAGADTINIEAATSITGGVTLTGVGASTTNTNLVVSSAGVVSAAAIASTLYTVAESGTTGTGAITAAGNSILILEPRSSFTAGTTIARDIQLPEGAAGLSIKISNLSGQSSAYRLVTDGTEIAMRDSATATAGIPLDDASASFELVYTNADNGWVIIGAN